MSQRFIHLFLCMLVSFVVGCGGEKKPEGMPALHKTTLTFKQDGAPLADATITLVPQETANTQWPSGGTTDSNGVIQVKTMQFNGVPEGKFKITVLKTETEGTDPVVETTDGTPPKSAPTNTVSNVKAYNLIEEKYRKANLTDLELEVKPGKNEKTFEVGKAVRELVPVYNN